MKSVGMSFLNPDLSENLFTAEVKLVLENSGKSRISIYSETEVASYIEE